MTLATKSHLETLEKLALVFTPASPIEKRDLFSGRLDHIGKVREAVMERGRHVVIYGERGVGKTSLANIVKEVIPEPLVIKCSADTSDNFDTLWRKVFSYIRLFQEQQAIGFTSTKDVVACSLEERLPPDKKILPSDVIQVLYAFHGQMIIIIDEFDRVSDQGTKTLMADTIKAFADSLPFVTLLLVGVAETVTDLIGEHSSIERNLRQVKLPRMSLEELDQIIDRGLKFAEMTIDDKVRSSVTRLSQGFPHYTHLLALYSAKEAIDKGRSHIAKADFEVAIRRAIDDTQESIKEAYHRATMSSRKTLFPDVLLAAALVKEDDYGTFRASDILSKLVTLRDTYKTYGLNHITYHLGKLTSPERNAVLSKMGSPKRYRYRFTNPLMKPYVIMKGLSDGLLDEDLFDTL